MYHLQTMVDNEGDAQCSISSQKGKGPAERRVQLKSLRGRGRKVAEWNLTL